AETVLKQSGMALIPLGSVEQHGPHLPCGTDYLAILAITRRAAQQLQALLVPLGPLGVTPFHMAFAGTVTLRSQTLISLLEDVCTSLVHHGAKKLALVNWHEGNTAAMNLAATAVRQQHDIRLVVVQACYIAEELFGREVGLTHGGTLEALGVLACHPELVHLERATNPSPMEHAARLDALRRRRTSYPILGDIRQMYPTGWYGPHVEVTPERAEQFLEGVAEAVARQVRETLAALEGPS
ncbi:MAG: creatininase family protein, partial [Dehalococcoidia bacterium]